MKKYLLFTLAILVAFNALAKEPVAQLNQLFEDYHKKLMTVSIAADPERLEKLVTGATMPYAFIYEPSDLYRWLLFEMCYYEWDADTLGTTIDLEVEYSPIDDNFSVIPAFFTLGTRRPSYALDSYKNMWISVFKSVGTNTVVLIDKADSRYGYPGHEYCLSCYYNGSKMVIHCNFLLIDQVACAIYYITSDTYYNSYLYKISFELVLAALDFKPFTGAQVIKSASPVSFSMSQNYPNPFNATTRIDYSVATARVVTLELFNIRGELMKTIFQEHHPPGNYSIDVDAAGFSSGVYLYRISCGTDCQTHRMIVLR